MRLLILLLLLLLFTPAISFAQTFEGKISYANSYKSNSPQLKDEQLGLMMGTIQDYYIKGGDYKSIVNGSLVKMQLYRSAENRSYTLTGKSDLLYWEDYGKNKDVATKFDIERGKETIMGVICDVLIVYTPKSKTFYYYSNKYGVNPGLFKQHAYGNWYYIISKTKALPLKIVYEDKQFTLTSIAVNISPMKLEAKLFEVPDKSKIVPATW
ncbi:hypothetical protein GO495_09430 [Chitinophaga oryziterrae]|uniref:DUF4412 domain-containing protein n=1 Tax=Chitinophaga oryziterrae TaxID=1031224 RepID=A0A6N8J8F0_9BACT|nr:hypothetical protein [Chitinophaga oryziterrae]MVT40798.1 hypothetical protein [Chitinophaga oryziterrae]